MPNWRSVKAVGKDVLFGVLGAELDQAVRGHLAQGHDKSSVDPDKRIIALYVIETRLSEDAQKNLSRARRERGEWLQSGGKFSASSSINLTRMVSDLAVQVHQGGAESDQALEVIEYLLADDQRLEEAVKLYSQPTGGMAEVLSFTSAYLPRAKGAVQEVVTGIVEGAKKADRYLSEHFNSDNPPLLPGGGIFVGLINRRLLHQYAARRKRPGR